MTLNYKARDGIEYKLNFIDTPGHVDFSYEVSRSLYACEGALLVVDAGQGVEAQSVANCYTAIEQGLEVVPVLNKMDLPQAEPDRVAQEIEDIIGIEATDAVRCSAKSGLGVEDVLEDLIRKIPPPKGDRTAPLQALIIDSWFDNYLGVVSLVRVTEGTLKKGDKIVMKSTGKAWNADKVGIFNPKPKDTDILESGDVGFVVAGIKDIHGAPVGDTIVQQKGSEDIPMLPGFKRVKPQVYAGLFPVSSDDYNDFRDALEKLPEASTDMILADLYNADRMSPAQAQKQFVDECARVLTEDGWLVLNYHRTPDVQGAYFRRLKRHFAVLLGFRSKSNDTVVYASKQHFQSVHPKDPVLAELESRLPIDWRRLMAKVSRME